LADKNSLTKTINIIKNLFSSKNKSLFGIDIGSSSVKVAEVEAKWGKKPKLTLLHYGYAPLPEGAIIEDEIQKPEEIQAAIKAAVEDSGIVLKSCTLGLFGPNTVAKKLQLAGGSYEEIEDQVLWESEQYLPFSIDESTIDFHIIGENEGGGVDIIVAAVKDDVKHNYNDLVEAAGINTKVFDLNTIAMTNIFEVVHQSQSASTKDESYLLLDIGAQTTSFTIYRRGTIQFSKEIASGGMMITEEIQRRMGLNFYEAEDLKSNQDENGNLPEEIIEIVDDIVEMLFSEIKKTLDFYIVSTSDESLVACYITGGGTLCTGIQGGLEELLGVRVSLLNPLDIFEVNEKKFSDEKIKNITFRGCAVLGLALREMS
jgi:type IV pilus assembly protein PilM